MTHSIIQEGDARLRQTATPVEPDEFGTPALRKLVATMSDALSRCDDGVALAAPQVGVLKRLFIVSRRALHEEHPDLPPPAEDLVFINPRIVKQSKRGHWLEEGCLSVRWWYGQVKRAEKVSVEAQDLEGRKFTHHGTGLLAQIFQHELDHLEGVLFSDKARDLREITPDADHPHVHRQP